jgi:pimeloyl-ACP methyl ester carboxylesterase
MHEWEVCAEERIWHPELCSIIYNQKGETSMSSEGRINKIQSDGAVVAFAAKPSITQGSRTLGPKMRGIAMACANSPFLNLLDRVLPVAKIDLRGQVIRGTRLENEDLSAFEISKFNNDVNQVAKSIRANRFVMFGYSIGGYFAVKYAAANQNRVAALVLLEPALFTQREDLLKRAQLAESGTGVKALQTMLAYVAPRVSEESRKKMAALIQKDWQSTKSIANSFRIRAEKPVTQEELASLHMPVLLIGGTDSEMAFQVKRATETIPHAHVSWIKGANHLDLVEAKGAKQTADVSKVFLTHSL